MQIPQRNTVQFKSTGFNTSEVLRNFINDCCFGEDVALWLRPRLQTLGYEVIEPGGEDWGWYLECSRDCVTHTLNIGCVFEDEGPVWRIDLERRRPVLDRLFGRNRNVEPVLAQALHGILTAAPEATDIKWYTVDGRGQELGPSPAP